MGRAERGSAEHIERVETRAVLAESCKVGLSQEELDAADNILGLNRVWAGRGVKLQSGMRTVLSGTGALGSSILPSLRGM